MSVPLFDRPNWVYLLREFESLYRYGSHGGSRAIRSHRRRVRETLASLIAANPPLVERPPHEKPVVAHLQRAIDLGRRGVLAGFSRALMHVTPELTWEYGYDRVPRGLKDKYAYCEIMGPHGPILADRLILGFVLLAPNTTYPQHHHKGIEESYISIAGAWSENDAAIYAPGSLILNKAEQEHRITTGELEPCLLAYAWIGPAERLAAPGMTFSTGKR